MHDYLSPLSSPKPQERLNVLERFEMWAADCPELVAVSALDGALTYGELDALADEHAEGWRGHTLIALRARHTTTFVAELIGAWKAGAAFVPVSPELPAQRMDQLRAAVDTYPSPGGLAYVVLISSSTGAPTGVAIEHWHLAAYVESIVECLAPRPGAVFGLCSALTDDVSYTSLFTPLATGGAIRLVDPGMDCDPDALAALLGDNPVDYLKTTPSHLDTLLDNCGAISLLPATCLVLSGALPSRNLIERVYALRPGLRLLHDL